MRKMISVSVLACTLLVGSAWGAGFKDDFDRPNGNVGNGWSTQTDGTITVEIVDNEVLVAGTQGTDWARCGISRPVVDESKVACDFKAGESFNFHIRIDSAGSSAFFEVYTWGGPLIHANSPDGSWPGWTDITNSNITAGEYNTVGLELIGNDITVTLNGTAVGTFTNAGFTRIESVLIASDSAAGTTGRLHIDNVVIGEVVLGVAGDPRPENNATDVPRDVVLGWTAAETAAAHDVYFGTVLEDVDAATRANPMGVLVSQGQSGISFDPAGLLDYEQTYYWRIDEVNGAPDYTVFKGDVWTFTVEPYVYPVQGIIATASSAEATAGPQNTINGSGLNASDQHSVEATHMWLTDASNSGQPVWIQYEFPQVYKLHEMWVWNYNVQFELVLGFGLKQVAIEHSVDGVEWTALGDYEFARATAKATYAANTIVDLDGVAAKYVRLTASSNWSGMMPQFGLSEVRFYYKPVVAREPVPADSQSGLDLDVVLDWRGGREAASHEVYFGSDRAAVADGTALAGTVDESRYAVSGLDLGKIYYWKVDEVNEAAIPTAWAGPIWSFSTKEYVTVEDFEAYNDDIDAGTAIFQTWIDGWENDTGSTVGYLETPFAERRIVFAGSQAMPLEYNNTASPFYSETQRDFGGADWTVNGADTLVVHFRGNAATTAEAPGNDPAPLYIVVEDRAGRTAVATHPDPAATVLTTWQTWEIPFSALNGVTLSNVETMYIGVGSRSNPAAGGSGRVFIDEIGVGHPGNVDPGNSGLVAYYALDGNVEDGSGNGHHGTAVGDPVYVAGQVGSGLSFDGTGAQYVSLGTLNPSAATGLLSVSLWANWNGLSGQYQGLIGKRDSWAAAQMMWQIEANIDTGIVRLQREGIADIATAALPIGEWYHVAITFDGAVGKVYMGGALGAEAAFSFGTDPGSAMVFGASVANGGNPFNGALDEIRIYDRALSPFEIRYLAGQ